MKTKELIEAVLQDPEALFHLKQMSTNVVGVWEAATSAKRRISYQPGSTWRLKPDGSTLRSSPPIGGDASLPTAW